MSSRILIIEDEPALVRGLKDAFVSKGFDVLTAQDGAAGLDLALEKNPDLILLDIMLPRVNGYEICRTIRERGIETPILMLTAKGQEEDIILGLNLGADDYIAKPFRIGELIARVNAFLRRTKAKYRSALRQD
jgi:DNA-binding response OmpR family regulator